MSHTGDGTEIWEAGVSRRGRMGTYTTHVHMARVALLATFSAALPVGSGGGGTRVKNLAAGDRFLQGAVGWGAERSRVDGYT